MLQTDSMSSNRIRCIHVVTSKNGYFSGKWWDVYYLHGNTNALFTKVKIVYHLLQRAGYWLCYMSIANWYKKCWIINPEDRNKNGKKIRNVKTIIAFPFSVTRKRQIHAQHISYLYTAYCPVFWQDVSKRQELTLHAYIELILIIISKIYFTLKRWYALEMFSCSTYLTLLLCNISCQLVRTSCPITMKM